MLISDRLEQTKFSPSEQAVVKYLKEKKHAIKQQTIKEAANQTYTNPATFIKVAKKLGFNGWASLIDSYLAEIDYLNSNLDHIDANIPFTVNDSIMTIASKLTQLSVETVQDTQKLINNESLLKAVHLMDQASEIKIFTNNNNNLIIQDFCLKMNRIKKRVGVSILKGEEKFEAANCDKNDCALLISYTGDSPTLIDLIPILRENQVPIVAITSIGNNILSELSDCVLNITTREKLYTKIGNFTTNTAIIHLLNIIYAAYFSLRYESNLEHLIKISKLADFRQSSLDIINE
ncbi:MurR/RpiR family transcriptional regulator [Paenibacillus taichungensis]|uniref:MurR/RpiR family transcriptional regulator n=1 Tax=Paenibacillus taichungensis TaxID=484184 RepID=A0ABX2MS91_9BACL|nr:MULTISPECIES: MurR/RpiR family transcriptional regulator [Paenibacillus]NUU56958.1 MurR/RpiR family transcriptional regulator [Paenibacillus taichungensis]PIH60279.1 sugar isomerase [Paenibacillus sp. LK1]